MAPLFAGYTLFESARAGDQSADEIRLTMDELARLEILFESQWRRSPTPEEL